MRYLTSIKLFAYEIHRCKHIDYLTFSCHFFNRVNKSNDD